jgi:hypothetical protein
LEQAVPNNFQADGFDFYQTADINVMGWTTGVSASGTVSFTIGPFGRNGTQGLRLSRNDNLNANAVVKAVRAHATTQTPINGFAFSTTALPPVGQYRLIAQVLDGATSQLDLFLLGNGTLQVKQGTGAILGTTTFVVVPNVYYYLEIQAKIDNTTGTVDLFVDDGHFASPNVLSVAGVDTQGSANASSDGFALCHQASDVTDITDNFNDDYYHTDTSDSVYPAPLGNVYVLSRRPNASGFYGEWDTVGAPVDYQAVNELLQDGDAKYIKAATAGLQSTFPLTGVPVDADILAVVQVHVSRTVGGAGQAITPEWRIAGVDYLGVPFTATGTYAGYFQSYTQSPATGKKWLSTEFNAAEMGEKKG